MQVTMTQRGFPCCRHAAFLGLVQLTLQSLDLVHARLVLLVQSFGLQIDR